MNNDREWLVVVAADGAGSATRSDIGARRACQVFFAMVEKYLLAGLAADAIDDHRLFQWLEQYHSTISEQAEYDEHGIREYASTLLVTIVGNEHLVCFQLGDGAVVFGPGCDGREVEVVTWPDRGEYENETFFLTTTYESNQFSLEIIDGSADTVAIFTDGLQRLALDYTTRQPHPPFFRPFFDALGPELSGSQEELSMALARHLDSPAFNARTDDDKTLVIASRRTADASALIPTPGVPRSATDHEHDPVRQ